jgi:two-component system, OmpR family, response regulator VicR
VEENTVLTTGEIAKYCGVNFRTVIRWIKQGRLKAYQLPGRGDNRVSLEDFLGFLKENNIPVPQEFRKFDRRILIVDDDESLARSIDRTLKRAGFETVIANDGFQAGSILETFTPTLMTLDLQMPGIRGQEVIRFVRSKETLKHIKILVVSAMPKPQLEEARKIGADDVLEKPFDNESLLEKVEALFAR